MRIPVFYMGQPEEQLWLTDEHDVSTNGQPVLIDTTGCPYSPDDVLGPLIIRLNTCSQEFYDAAQKAGYQVVWMD